MVLVEGTYKGFPGDGYQNIVLLTPDGKIVTGGAHSKYGLLDDKKTYALREVTPQERNRIPSECIDETGKALIEDREPEVEKNQTEKYEDVREAYSILPESDVAELVDAWEKKGFWKPVPREAMASDFGKFNLYLDRPADEIVTQVESNIQSVIAPSQGVKS